MIKRPKFSIIVPVYNVEKYLSICIESLINQTLKDIEIICVNDGSTDSSLNILWEYEEIDHRIKILDKVNGGLSSARNAGLNIAEGEYILFVDSDDYLETNTCDRLYMEMLQESADIVVFGTQIFPSYISSPYIEWLWNNLRVETKKYEKNTIQALFCERASKPFVWNECYKRELLKKNEIKFDEDIRYGEDMLFLFMVFPRAHKVVYIEDKLYCYRCAREGSLMDQANSNSEWKIEMHMLIVEKILKDWKINNFIDKAKDELYYWCLEFMVYDLEEMDLSDDFRKKSARRIFDLFKNYGLKFSVIKKKNSIMEQKLERLM